MTRNNFIYTAIIAMSSGIIGQEMVLDKEPAAAIFIFIAAFLGIILNMIFEHE